MVLERRHRDPIYIWVTYTAHAAHSISKVSQVSTLPRIGHAVT